MGPQKKYTKCTVTGFHPLSVVHNFPYLWQHFSSTLVKISIEVDLHCCPIRQGCFYVQKEPECLLFCKLCTKLFLGHGIFLSSHWFFNMLGRWEAWRCTSSLTLSMAPPIWLVWTFNVSSIFFLHYFCVYSIFGHSDNLLLNHFSEPLIFVELISSVIASLRESITLRFKFILCW